MKILQVVHHFFPNTMGGTEVVTYNLSKEFQKRGHQTAVFYSEFEGSRRNFSVQGNFYENLQTFRVYNDMSQSLFGLGAYKDKKIDRFFASFLDRFLPDVVHFHHLIDLSWDMVDECKKRNISVFLTLHDFWLMCPQTQRYHNVKKENCHHIDYRECPACIEYGIRYMFREKRRNAVKRKLGYLSGKRFVKIDSKDIYFFALNQKRAKKIGPKNHIITYGSEIKNYIYMHPDSRMIFKKIHFNKGDIIKFRLTIPENLVLLVSGIVKFKILLDKEVIFDKQIDTKRIAELPEFQVEISEDQVKHVTLETKGIGPVAYCGATWENIRVEKKITQKPSPIDPLIDWYFNLRRKIKPISIAWLEKREQYIKSKLPAFETIFAPTPFLYDQFKKWGAPNLVFSEDAIETKLFENFSKNRNLEKEIRFAFIGSIYPTKGVHILIEAFNNIKEKNVFLDIYGEINFIPEYREKLKNLVKNKNIKFCGTFEKNKIGEVFKKFDVLVMPVIWFENAPLVIRNAILAKTPVIATDVGGINFLIKDGENGLTFRLGDEKHLQQQIEKIIKNPRLIETFSKHMPKIKNVEESAEELEGYYLETLQKINRSPQITAYPKVETYKYKVSIVIPTYNGAEFLDEVITMIKKQKVDFSYEIVFVDSGSTDGTLEIIKKHRYTFYLISKEDFNHGLTRNFGVSKTSGEIIVVLTQDAIPGDENWLQEMIKYYDDEEVVGVYVKQVPRGNCNYITAKRINESFIGRDKIVVNKINNFKEYAGFDPNQKYAMTNFDNVCGSFRRQFWEKNPYRKMDFGEDLRFGIDIILAGKKIVYTPEAAVIHSHNRSIIYEYKRYYLSHILFVEFYDLAAVPNIKVLFFAIKNLIKNDLKYIWKLPISFWKKISHSFFIFPLDILTNAAGFKAFRDFKRGKMRSYKI